MAVQTINTTSLKVYNPDALYVTPLNQNQQRVLPLTN